MVMFIMFWRVILARSVWMTADVRNVLAGHSHQVSVYGTWCSLMARWREKRSKRPSLFNKNVISFHIVYLVKKPFTALSSFAMNIELSKTDVLFLYNNNLYFSHQTVQVGVCGPTVEFHVWSDAAVLPTAPIGGRVLDCRIVGGNICVLVCNWS